MEEKIPVSKGYGEQKKILDTFESPAFSRTFADYVLVFLLDISRLLVANKVAWVRESAAFDPDLCT